MYKIPKRLMHSWYVGSSFVNTELYITQGKEDVFSLRSSPAAICLPSHVRPQELKHMAFVAANPASTEFRQTNTYVVMHSCICLYIVH